MTGQVYSPFPVVGSAREIAAVPVRMVSMMVE